MTVSVRKIDLWGWTGIELAGERVSLVITPEIGGRIISLALDGEETLFSLPELRGKRFPIQDARDVRARKKELGWLHYGGYKTWLAPQARWTEGLPFLDLNSGSYEYEIAESHANPIVRLSSPVCRETGIQFTRTLSLDDTGRVVVEQGMTNTSSKEVEWGLWDVTQLCGPGQAVLPTNRDSRFRGGVKAYSTEGHSPDVMDRYVTRKQNLALVSCREIEPFKYGTDSTEGWILGLLDKGGDRSLAYLKSFKPEPGGIYPHEAVVEVYDSGTLPYFELEVHSPLKRLDPDTTYCYTETWILNWLPKKPSAEEIREWVGLYLLTA
ncbi:MAG: hypothetical protein ACE5JO_10300 [Candidatus Binatia bacterium]